jgi:hypothetical protein
MRDDLAKDGLLIPIAGTNEWLSAEELIGSIVVQQMSSQVLLRLANGESVIVYSIDLDFDERDNNA